MENLLPFTQLWAGQMTADNATWECIMLQRTKLEGSLQQAAQRT
jgi:hypothetical protein